jgi:hypothetical protein
MIPHQKNDKKQNMLNAYTPQLLPWKFRHALNAA